LTLQCINSNANSINVSAHEATLQQLLLELLITVKLQGYKFITVTPRTHEHFLSSHSLPGKNLHDIFGWNLPFFLEALSPMLQKIMHEAGMLEYKDGFMRSKLRISSVDNDLFLHSAFPTTDSDAVFFGPDTYRFVRFIRHSFEKDKSESISQQYSKKPIRILDIGCGTGAGGIAAVRALPQGCPFELTLNDVNQNALELACINARAAKIPVRRMLGDILVENVFDTLDNNFDLIISNPPYMKDESARTYRDGGAQLGLSLSIRIFQIAFEHLAPGGKLLLYTGVAMTNQSDPFLATIKPWLMAADCDWSYEEIDPDIFGEELASPSYSKAYRIAAVGLLVRRH
jgi:methylase of polypeptide subunit release factors